MPTDDTATDACAPMRDAISALVDGEDPGVDPRLVDAHLGHCARCRAFREVSDATRRAARIAEAPQMPDLSRRVTKLAAIADRASSWSLVRAALAVVGIEIIAFSVPDIVATDSTGRAAHDSRHLGAFTIAYGVALLLVVVRPARARTILPVALVLAGALVITAGVDLSNGNVPLVREVVHLPEVLSVGLVWLLASPSRRRTDPRRQARTPELRVVEHAEREAG